MKPIKGTKPNNIGLTLLRLISFKFEFDVVLPARMLLALRPLASRVCLGPTHGRMYFLWRTK